MLVNKCKELFDISVLQIVTKMFKYIENNLWILSQSHLYNNN